MARRGLGGVAGGLLLALLYLVPTPVAAGSHESPAPPKPTPEDAEALDAIESSTDQEVGELAEDSVVGEQRDTPSPEVYRDVTEDAIPVDPKPDPVLAIVDPRGYKLSWNQGVRLQRNDGAFRGKLGARLEGDFASIHGDPGIASQIGGLGDFWELRRGWITLSGTVGSRFFYKAQVDATGNSEGDDGRNPYVRDAFVALTGLGPLGTVKVGFVREPFAIGDLTSSLALSFMERSLVQIFAPTYNPGVVSENTALDRHLAWSWGVFYYSDVDTDSGRLDVTGRISGLPLFEDEGERLVHVGASYSHQFRDDFDLRYRRRPESHQAQRFVDTLDFVSEDVDLFGLELATVQGSLMALLEFAGSVPERPNGRSDFFWAGTVHVSWFLTGEHWPYLLNRGIFGRVVPRNNFRFRGGGWGAFELAARYSYADLNSGDVRGGILSDTTLALNWYINSYLRIQTNYIHAHLNGVGAANIYQMRFQIDF